jgi:hypothetical protein
MARQSKRSFIVARKGELHIEGSYTSLGESIVLGERRAHHPEVQYYLEQYYTCIHLTESLYLQV